MSSSKNSLMANHRVNGLQNFLEKYKDEVLFFFAIFVVLIFSTKLSNSGSNGNVEQWINMFHGHHDFLFSYGPLYWLTGQTVASLNKITYWTAVFFISITNAFFWTLIFNLIRKSKNYVLFIVVFVLFFNNIIVNFTFFMWPFILIIFIEFSSIKYNKRNTLLYLFLGAIVAFTFYVRFFYGLLGLLTIGSYLFSQFITRKKLSDGFYFSVSVVIFYILFGFIIFHDNINIINYLKINSQLSFGNSVDMTLGVENTVGCYISVMLIFLLLNAYIILNKRNNLLLTINIIFIILFKLGFSRTDHYISYFVYPIAAMSLVMIFERRLVNNILFLSVIACLFYLVSNPIYPNARTIDYLSVNIDANKSFNERIANTYPEFKLKKEILDEVGNSSIDIYPYNNEYAFSNSLNYVPRPVFQNYMTLTPKLGNAVNLLMTILICSHSILVTSG